jgi:CHAT domain-containing protein/tetratricopeptide (TPR) repeat protein
MKYLLMIACLFSLPVGLSILSTRPAAGAAMLQSQQSSNQSGDNQAEDIRPLALSDQVEREISGAAKHIYKLSLRAGVYVQASVQHKGINAIALLYGSDGKILQDFVDPVYENRARTILFIAQSDNDHYILIRPRSKDSPVGRYQLTLEAVRPATETDQIRVRAWNITEDANRTERRAYVVNQEEAQKITGKLEEALKLWRLLDNNLETGKIFLSLGRLNYRAGDYTKALEFYDKALPIFPETPEGVGSKATTMNSMATAYLELGETRKSLDVYLKSLELKKEEGRSRSVTLNNIGNVYRLLGEYQLALDHHMQALETFRALGQRNDESVALNYLALLWERVGDPAMAVEYTLQALSLIRDANLNLKESEALYLSNAGNFYFLMGSNQQALTYANQSLDLSRAINDRQTEARSLGLLCKVYHSLGEFEKASIACNRALLISHEKGDLTYKAGILASLIRVYERTGERRKAVESGEAALAIYRAIGDPTGELTTLHALGRLALEDGDPVSARNQIERAVEIAESLRVKAGSHQMRSLYLSGRQEVYESYIDTLMELHRREPGNGYDRAALQVSERARARSLLDLLAEGRGRIRQGADQALLEKERGLLERLNDKDAAWKKLRNDERTKKQAESVANDINDLTTQLQVVEERIRSSKSRYAALTRPKPLVAVEIQQLLDENTVLLEYALGEKQSWLWAVTRDSISSHCLQPRAEINAAARDSYGLLTARQPKKDTIEGERLKLVAEADAKLQSETRTLSRMLLGPISARLQQEWKGKRLAIVASGALEYIPFAALSLPEAEGRREGETEGQMARGTLDKHSPSFGPSASPSSRPPVPLIADHEVVNLPSASALALIRRETAGRQAAEKTLAALADPVFDTGDPRLATAKKKASAQGLIANARSAESSAFPSLASTELTRSVQSFHRDGFCRLVFTNEEAEYITGFAPRGSTLKATGFEASRSLVASGELGRYRIVHFATHGLINSEHPELSGLVLSLVDENGKPQDGFLRMREIFDLRLPADLVVLSACQTALGKEIKGEGLIGLTRGFMYAGAERVVASLWQVDDQATADLMQYFYRGMLKEKLRPAAALRAAQIEMSRSSRWSSPYYWAGFVIQGEWR